MFKTFISFLLAIALCVCSVGCGATTGPLADPFKNQADSASVSGVADDGSSKKEEYSTLKGYAIMFAIIIPIGLLTGLTVAYTFKKAGED